MTDEVVKAPTLPTATTHDLAMSLITLANLLRANPDIPLYATPNLWICYRSYHSGTIEELHESVVAISKMLPSDTTFRSTYSDNIEINFQIGTSLRFSIDAEPQILCSKRGYSSQEVVKVEEWTLPNGQVFKRKVHDIE
jgi:hypothetical protein